jgi:NDP-sugar pyrophosphorylase family protein
MQILVPLAGRSPFFPPDQYFFPKSLIEVAGVPMIERAIGNLRTISSDPAFIFVVHHDDVARFSLDRTLRLLTGDRCTVISLRGPTRGALCSALLAVDHLDLARPLVIANADQVIDADLAAITAGFDRQGARAGVIAFDSVHPRWSYVAVDEAGNVSEAAEKRVISRNAIAGYYYFDTAGTFIDAATRCIENDGSVEGQFFIAPCLNEIILDGGHVASRHIPAHAYHSFYSPEKIDQFEDENLRRSIELAKSAARPEVRVLIPAAGAGSRFANAGYTRPKPFIDVLGRPMIDHVIRNVAPSAARIHLLLQKDHILQQPDTIDALRGQGHTIHEVDRLTEGTVCTLLLARDAFDDEHPLLVANADQHVDFSPDAFVRDCLDRNLDGSILVFREPSLDPKWSFARLGEDGLVLEVAEKRPISDLATAGIYLFRSGAQFVRSAIDMIARNDRVNNEFYTCPVYNYMISRRLRIGVFEVAASAMHGLGTPRDLQAYLASMRPAAG